MNRWDLGMELTWFGHHSSLANSGTRWRLQKTLCLSCPVFFKYLNLSAKSSGPPLPSDFLAAALLVDFTSFSTVQFSSAAQSYPTLQPHGLQHTRPPCASPAPGVYSNSCPLSQWCHPTISSSVICFSSHLQSFPASGSFPMTQFFISGSQSIGISASASVLPMNIQDWFPLGWTGWISLLSKGLSRVFSNTTVHKH